MELTVVDLNQYGKNQQANHSRRRALLDRIGQGMVANTCPFGCQDEDHNEQGYCHHVVGTTVPGSKTIMEPLGYDRRGMRVTNGGKDAKGVPIVPKRQKVKPGDHLELVTVSHLVYRKDAPKWRPAELEVDGMEADEIAAAELERERLQLEGKL